MFSVDELRTEVEAFLAQLMVANGRKWGTSRKAIVIVGDASESKYGTFPPHGMLLAPVIVTFLREERERMAAWDFSSTEREVTACCPAYSPCAGRVLASGYHELKVGVQNI